MSGYDSYSYIVVITATAGNNKLYHTMINIMASTYYKENIFMQVINYHDWASSQD